MIIAVASGKGGTGKTTVSVNLAASAPFPVRLLDCDVEEPNAHLFIESREEERREKKTFIPVIDTEKCNLCGKCEEVCRFSALVIIAEKLMSFPEMCHSCLGCLRICPENAISDGERVLGEVIKAKWPPHELIWGEVRIGEAMSPPLIDAVKESAEKDMPLILDAPPGTSCPMLAAVRDVDFILLVTEPTPFGMNDLELAVKTARLLNIPCAIILNRAEEEENLIKDYARLESIPILMEIPFKREYARAYSEGKKLIDVDPALKKAFEELWENIEKEVKAEKKS